MKIDISQYKRIVILTGAGVSAASGIRTFRGKDGIWDEYNVEEYGHVDRLNDNPHRIWELFGSLRTQLINVQPNQAHYVLAEIEKKIDSTQTFTLITQNIDGLHQQAGNKNVIELHGSIHQTCCPNSVCNLEPYDDDDPHANEAPFCPNCSFALKPNIVLFGEQIPAKQDWLSKRALRDCDLFISIGTSASVFPAANFVRAAEYAGARTIFINLEPLPQSTSAFKEVFIGKAEDILPHLFGLK